MPRIYKSTDISERLFSRVEKTASCWIWKGSVNNKGYGQIFVTKKPRHVVKLVHRVSFELANGPIPPGLGVLHKCDTPTCLNPDHLFLGDQQTNMDDCRNKGRTAKGGRSGVAKLTENDVLEIRRIFTGAKGESAQIAARYGVSRKVISRVLRREGWNHI